MKGGKLVFPNKINEFFTNLENLGQFLKEEYYVNNQKNWTKVYFFIKLSSAIN